MKLLTPIFPRNGLKLIWTLCATVFSNMISISQKNSLVQYSLFGVIDTAEFKIYYWLSQILFHDCWLLLKKISDEKV